MPFDMMCHAKPRTGPVVSVLEQVPGCEVVVLGILSSATSNDAWFREFSIVHEQRQFFPAGLFEEKRLFGVRDAAAICAAIGDNIRAIAVYHPVSFYG
jgi:hypothetical protein